MDAIDDGWFNYQVAKILTVMVFSGQIPHEWCGDYEGYHDASAEAWCMVEQIIAEATGLVGEGDL